MALGFSLVFYPTAYYSAATGSFGDAISGIRYPIDSIRFDFTSKILENMFFLWLVVPWFGICGLYLFRSLSIQTL